MNTLANNNDSLRLIELFSSIQGETSLSGLPTTFIRLASCNLRCTWCDTSYSFGPGKPHLLQKVVDEVEQRGHKNVCITGGEPLLQKGVYPLMTTLCDRGYSLSLETNGSLSTEQIDPRVYVILDIKCPGSGEEDKNHWPNIQRLRPHDEVKFIIRDRCDFEWARDLCQEKSLLGRKNEVLFSPAYGILEAKDLATWILQDRLSVRLNTQIHKIIWPNDDRGV